MSSLLASRRPAFLPVIPRESISWRTVAPGWLEISVELENPGHESTEAGELVIETAALGAFVPFTPAARVAVGALEPGGRRRVQTRVAPALPAGTADALVAKGLPADFIELLGRSEWAGNVNVYFDRGPERAVEVHRALGLRVTAGRPVACMVDLPADRDAYGIELRVSDPEWKARIAPFCGPFHVLVVEPPARAGERAEVTVDVTRLKDSKTVPVDFSFETVEG